MPGYLRQTEHMHTLLELLLDLGTLSNNSKISYSILQLVNDSESQNFFIIYT